MRRSLASFVIGGIIAVIFIKTLEWQRSQNHEERGERRTIFRFLYKKSATELERGKRKESYRDVQ